MIKKLIKHHKTMLIIKLKIDKVGITSQEGLNVKGVPAPTVGHLKLE